MKQRIYKAIVLFVATVLSGVCFMSCDNDSHDPDIELSGDISDLVPSYSVRLLCSYSLSNNSIQLSATPSIYLNLDKWGLKITKVDYYVDDVYIETKTISPYEFTYESNEWYPGAHVLRAEVIINGNNIETLVLPCVRVLNNSSSGLKAADVYFDYNYVTTGDELCLTVGFNPDRSEPGTKIVSAKCSWDGETIGEKSSSPYEFRKIISDAAGTTHDLSASVTYDQGGVQTTNSFSYSSYEICGPNTLRQSYSICSRYRDFENGEKLRGKATVFKGSEVTSNAVLEVYLDEEMIMTTQEFPYEHEYLLTGLSVGQHKLTKTWIRYDENWVKQGSISYYETITITK